jgi:hypothetical protein
MTRQFVRAYGLTPGWRAAIAAPPGASLEQVIFAG